MSDMQLLGSPTSPYVRKVLVLAHEAGIIDRLPVEAASGTPLAPNARTVGHNPLGKVPCLVLDDGPALYDSRVICEYLDAEQGEGRFFPQAGPARWRALTLAALGDGITDAGLLIVYEARLRPEEKQFSPFVEGQREKVVRGLDVAELQWLAHLSGPMDIGQIALACALGYVELRDLAPDWRSTRRGLAAWYDAFRLRPSMTATEPPKG